MTDDRDQQLEKARALAQTLAELMAELSPSAAATALMEVHARWLAVFISSDRIPAFLEMYSKTVSELAEMLRRHSADQVKH